MPIGSNATYTSGSDPRTLNLIATSFGSTQIAAWINAEQYSHPIYVATNSDPLYNVHYNTAPVGENGSGTPEYNGVVSFRIPSGAAKAVGSDAHLHIVDPDGRTLHEMWLFGSCSGTECTTGGYAPTNLYGSGIGTINGLNFGMRAYGGSAIGGLIRTWEVQAGQIRHPLAVALYDDFHLQQGWVWPATQEDSGSEDYGGLIPMGSLVAIPQSVNLSTLGLSPSGLMLAQAFKDYGAYIVDTSAGFSVYAEPSIATQTPTQLAAMRADLNKIRAQLRVVTNNGPSSVGGGGTPVVPLAPPLP
jgi:hypothetical protein